MENNPQVSAGARTEERSFLGRMKGAALLHVDVYEDVEADTNATGEAAGVVALVAVATAIGASGAGTYAIFAGMLSAFVGWLLWAGLTYIIGDKLLGGTATWGELLRTLGFAQAPGLLLVFGAVPGLRTIVALLVGVWTLVAGIIAIRQALDFGTGKALLTALLGAVVLTVLRLLF